VNDEVRVYIKLGSRAYAYLLALNPDGAIQLCVPADAHAPPGQVAQLVYPPPTDHEQYFGLTDGAGLQAFVLVASREPLPPFSAWTPASGLPWRAARSTEVWEFDGLTLGPRGRTAGTGPDRGTVRARSVAPVPLRDVCRRLREAPGVDLVRALAFPVVDREP
jgi:hypothetical protein